MTDMSNKAEMWQQTLCTLKQWIWTIVDTRTDTEDYRTSFLHSTTWKLVR